MQLKKLYLRNFRNYAEAEVEFSPRLNVFYGENAQGKTNLLEAIYLVSTARSFRTQNLSELIRLGEPFFYLEAHAVRDGAEQTLKLSFDGQTRRLQMAGNSYASFHPLLGTLPSVLYTPQDTDLISGAPALRRRFLNLHLAQRLPLHVHHLARFWRAMKHRNRMPSSERPEPVECEGKGHQCQPDGAGRGFAFPAAAGRKRGETLAATAARLSPFAPRQNSGRRRFSVAP